LHVDFLEVNLREEMTASVPINVVGEAPAVTRNEGLLLTMLDHVQVRALPMDLPPGLDLDISGLEEVDQALHVSDLTIPGNVTLLTPEDEMVVKITSLPVEEVEEVEEAEEGAEDEAAEGAEEGEAADEAGGAASEDES
jgi:large subunit ribosomal protein L25